MARVGPRNLPHIGPIARRRPLKQLRPCARVGGPWVWVVGAGALWAWACDTAGQLASGASTPAAPCPATGGVASSCRARAPPPQHSYAAQRALPLAHVPHPVLPPQASAGQASGCLWVAAAAWLRAAPLPRCLALGWHAHTAVLQSSRPGSAASSCQVAAKWSRNGPQVQGHSHSTLVGWSRSALPARWQHHRRPAAAPPGLCCRCTRASRSVCTCGIARGMCHRGESAVPSRAVGTSPPAVPARRLPPWF
jgi:hypothetical protein